MANWSTWRIAEADCSFAGFYHAALESIIVDPVARPCWCRHATEGCVPVQFDLNIHKSDNASGVRTAASLLKALRRAPDRRTRGRDASQNSVPPCEDWPRMQGRAIVLIRRHRRDRARAVRTVAWMEENPGYLLSSFSQADALGSALEFIMKTARLLIQVNTGFPFGGIYSSCDQLFGSNHAYAHLAVSPHNSTGWRACRGSDRANPASEAKPASERDASSAISDAGGSTEAAGSGTR